MAYHISRNGQTYGPYTLDDLERYVASGHVLLNDQARSDESPDYQPVANILRAAGRNPVAPLNPVVTYQPASGAAGYPPSGSAQSYGQTYPQGTATGYAAPGPYAQAAALQAPPGLNWALVLLFDVLTCSFFQMVWNIIMGAWFRRISPQSKALPLYIASAVLLIIQGISGQALGLMMGRHAGVYGGTPYSTGFNSHIGLYTLIATICWITRLVARFTFRAELERHFNTVDPIGLRINPFLTFFFGGIYLQSVLNRITETKRLQAYGVIPR